MGNDKELSGGLFFSIRDAAKQVGVVPATIRNWEKAGLIHIRKSNNGYRIFDVHDIATLKRIKTYSKEENIGINGIKMLCNQDTTKTAVPSDTKQNNNNVSKELLSSKWKEYRLERGYNLEDVAKTVGISASYLSKIENGQANVSYSVLERLAQFYGENILYYLADSQDMHHVVRKGSAKPFEIGVEGLEVESLIAQQDNTLSALMYTAEPGSSHSNPTGHTGEEFVYIFSGKVEFSLNGTKYMLSAGDSICFRSNESHSWENKGNRPARFLWVYTPLTKL